MAIQCIISLLLLIFFLLFSVGMRPIQQSLLTSMTMVMLAKSGKYVLYLFMQILSELFVIVYYVRNIIDPSFSLQTKLTVLASANKTVTLTRPLDKLLTGRIYNLTVLL